MNKKNQVYTVLFGGAAGDGVREAGVNFGRLLTRMGYSVFVTADYPSLIRGGHNFTRVTFSVEPVYSDYTALDVLVGFNAETINLHKHEVKKGGLVIYDSADKTITAEKRVIGLPIAQAAKLVDAKPIMRSALVLGSLCEYFELHLESLIQTFNDIFKDKAPLNVSLAREGFSAFKHLKVKQIDLARTKPKGEVLLSGNQASAEGLIKAGMTVYVAYPMTPASSIQEFLAKQAKVKKLKVVQAESEVAVVNMALGSAYAGAKTAVGTSGGGFALMQEGFSLAGISEIPLVVMQVQRTGPSTGVPTYAGQADLAFMRHAGHGEFPRIVLAAGDQLETYELSILAMNLSWQYQLPVVLLTDKHSAESFATMNLSSIKVKPGKIKMWTGKGNYQRYALAADGISPMAYPGMKNANVKVTSYEHDEYGLSVEKSEEVIVMQDKRFKKLAVIAKDKFPRLKVFGNKTAKTAVVFWGSTKGAMLEAAKYISKPMRMIQIITVEPFPVQEFATAVKGANKIIVVEGNHDGQLANIIQETTGTMIKNRILQYDGRPFEPLDLAKKLTKKL